jgi:hypothetical protein
MTRGLGGEGNARQFAAQVCGIPLATFRMVQERVNMVEDAPLGDRRGCVVPGPHGAGRLPGLRCSLRPQEAGPSTPLGMAEEQGFREERAKWDAGQLAPEARMWAQIQNAPIGPTVLSGLCHSGSKVILGSVALRYPTFSGRGPIGIELLLLSSLP